MQLTVLHLDQITGHTREKTRKKALAATINAQSETITDPHRLASFLKETMHESMGLNYVKEIWGPTKAQKRYEGRRDLGNVQPGDGRRFQGRDIIQVTGRSNYREFTKWANARGIYTNFEANPDKLEDPKYLGLGAIWYWVNRVPSRYVEAGNHEMVTRSVNGGLNGYADRLTYYDRAALAFLGYQPGDIMGFQAAVGLEVDGISGPATRAAMHAHLKAQKPNKRPTQNPEKPHLEGRFKRFFEMLNKLLRGRT